MRAGGVDMNRRKETPIERIFRKIMRRKMTPAERRVFFRKPRVKATAA